MRDTKTRAQQNRKIRQDALRAELKAREYLRQINDCAVRIYDGAKEMEAGELNALKAVADINFKRLAKCLPDLKAVEITGEDGGPVPIQLISFKDLANTE